MVKPANPTYFNEEWLTKPDYSEWLLKHDKDSKLARCKVCPIPQNLIKLSNMGERAVKSHGIGKKHKARLDLYKKTDRIGFAPAPAVSSSSSSSSGTVDSYAVSPSSIDAEIRWTLKNVLCPAMSYRNCDGLSDLFQSMFPDSEVGKSFTLGKSKCSYYVTHGLAPHFRSILVESIKESEFYSASFDESLNKVIQMGQMDMVVCYWDNTLNRSCLRYLDSSFLGHARHDDILEHFNEILKDFDQEKLLQVQMDGPRTNWAFYTKLSKQRVDAEIGRVLPTGSCGLHIVHGAFETGEKKTEWGLSKILKALYVLLHDTPARRADYIDITFSEVFPLLFCVTRWVEDEKVAVRAIEIWPNVCKIYEFWQGKPKSQRPSSKSYETILDATNDNLILAKLHFFAHVASLLKPFLTMYQCMKPMMPFLYSDLHALMKDIASKFIKPSVLDACKTALEICDIDFSEKKNQLKAKKVDIGFGADQIIAGSTRSGAVTTDEVISFREDCTKFLGALSSKLAERSPLKNPIVRNVKCFDPVLMALAPEKGKKFFRGFIANLLTLKRVTPGNGDAMYGEYKKYLETAVKLNKESFVDFNKAKDRLDEFFFDTIGLLDQFPLLAKCIKMALILIHGQAHVERGFNVNKGLLAPNMESASIKSQRLIYDHCKQNDITPESLEISADLRNSCKKARSKKRLDDDAKKAEEEKNSKKRKAETLMNDIAEVKSKKVVLEKVVVTLKADSEKLFLKAAEDEKLAYTYAVEAKSIVKEREAKLSEIEVLQTTIHSLEKKHKEL